jgi:RNA-splicing ligase RtcB
MPEERTVKKVFKNIPEGKGSVGKPRKRWLDDVENDLKKMDVRGWRKIDRDRDAWKFIL